MYNELSALTQAMQSVGMVGWSQVVMAAIVILIPLMFWDRVSSPGMLRTAGVLIALSFLLPPVLEMLLSTSTVTPTRRGGGPSTNNVLILLRLVAAVRPVCVGLSVLFAFFAVIPSGPRHVPSAPMPGTPNPYGENAPQRPQPFTQNTAPPTNGPSGPMNS